MLELSPREISLADPLSKETRSERRYLLAVSMVGIILVKTGLVPVKISALGIEFSQTNQKSMLTVISLVTIYFIVAFTIYAAADFIAWRTVYYRALRKLFTEPVPKQDPNDDLLAEKRTKNIEDQMKRERMVFLFSRPVMLLRIGFDFILPIAVGLYSVISLWKAPVH